MQMPAWWRYWWLSMPLMPGTYEIRVVNEASGIDTTKTITVNPGETTSVQASP